MLRTLLIATLLATSALTVCPSGCLKCVTEDSKQMCEICDLSRFYYATGDGTCSQSIQTNCEVPSLNIANSSCFRCKKGYFVDELMKICTEVPSSKVKDGCRFYTQLVDCAECEGDMYVLGGNCSSVTTKVDKCVLYDGVQTCVQCESGYRKNDAGSQCLAFEATDNCRIHTDFACKRCKSGFFYAYNVQLLSEATGERVQSGLMTGGNRVMVENNLAEVCVAQNIDHCGVYDSYGRCGDCADGYYSDPISGKCLLARESEIFKCAKYLNMDKCSECEDGYYLVGDKCEPRLQSFPNCKTLTPDAESCQVCEDDWFINAGTCNARVVSIHIFGCEERPINQDICSVCKAGMLKATDDLKCFFPIPNCAVPKIPASTGALECTTCHVATIPLPNTVNTTSCVVRNKPNCKIFSTNHSETCSTCHEEYYLSTGNCLPYTKKCKTRSSLSDACSACYNYQYLQLSDNTCHNYTVKNCNVLNTNLDKCTNCLGGHYIDSVTFSCLKYNLLNCGTPNPNQNTCDTCNVGFIKLSPTRCVPLDILGCLTPNYTAKNCTTCKPGYYIDGQSFCQPQKLPGCLLNSMSITAQTCSGCEAGFYLTDSKCHPYTVTNCLTGQLQPAADACNSCQPKFHKTAAGKCIPFTEWNCNAMTDAGDCTGCVTGFYLDSTSKKCILQAKTGCNSFASNTLNCSTCKTGFYKEGSGPDFSCLPFHVPNCETPSATGNDCATGCKTDYYWSAALKECLKKDMIGCNVYSASKTASVCTTATPIYFKIMVNDSTPIVLSNCFEQSTTNREQCLKCVDGYYLNTGTNLCDVRTARPNCLTFVENEDKCAKCKSNYYVNTGACAGTTSTADCVESDGVANACTTCKPNKKIAGANCSAVTTSKVVDNCKGNTTTGDVTCSVCTTGYYLIPSIKFARERPIFCETLSAAGACTQAREGFECSSATNCYPIGAIDSVCIKLKAATFASITTATSCAKCRNVKTHFYTAGTFTCAPRTAKPDCGVYDANADACLACREGLQYKSSGAANNDCTEAVAANNSTHCKFTVVGAVGCYECDEGYVVSGATNVCVVNRSNNENICRTVDSSVADGPRCTACREGYIHDSPKKTCIKNETCYRLANGTCDLCWEDYEPHPSNTMMCVPKLMKDDCLIHSVTAVHSLAGKSGACVRCKNQNMIPYNIWISGSSKYEYHCKRNDYIDFKYNVFAQVTTTRKFLPVFMPWDNATDLDGFGSTNANLKPLKGSDTISSNFCLDIRVPNCKTYNNAAFTTKVYASCLECNDGLYLSTNTRFGQVCERGNLSGCQIYESEHKCKVCHNGFYLKDNTTTKDCIPYENIPYCKIYESTTWGCAQCMDGYVPLGGVCDESRRKNCLHFYVHDNFCLQCQPNFYLSDFTCVPYTVGNCDVLEKTLDRCVLCEPNYYLNNAVGKCYKNTAKRCKIRSKTENRCIACEEGLFQDASSSDCIEFTIGDCLQQDPENGKCLVCENGFYLTKEDTCQPHSIVSCKMFEPYEDSCYLCQTGFFLSEFGVCLRHTLDHCMYPDPRRNRCLDCESNSFLIENGLCKLYGVRNCSIFQRHRDGCVSCLPGFYMNSSEHCLPYKLAKNCLVLNSYRDECRECLPHHFMSLNHCYKYTVNNCAVVKNDSDICIDCKRGFFLSDNLCEPYTMNNCSEFALNQNRCLGCNEGEYLEDGLCKPNTALFCTKKSPYSNTCLECPDDFYLHKGVCLPRVNSLNCKRAFLTADLCDSCYATHYKAAGFCISYGQATCKTFDSTKDLCVACETGKYWLSNHICEPYTVTDCKTPNASKDLCDACNEGAFYLGVDKHCHASSTVSSCEKYNLVKDECIKCDVDHYLHSGSECRKNPDGIYKCKNYATDKTCARCELGYYVFENYCERTTTLIDNCNNYVSDKVCGECKSGFTLSSNVCFQHVEASCKTWADSEKCATCGVNQVLNKSSATKVNCIASGIDSCLEATSEGGTNKCLVCVDGMYPSADACVTPDSPIVGCQQYQSQTVCNECGSLYTLNAEKSSCFTNSKYLTPNCDAGQEFSKAVCKVCAAGYQLESSNQCKQCGGDGCFLCDPWNTTQCLMCEVGFDHDGVKCSKPTAAASTTRFNKYSEESVGVWKVFSSCLLMMAFALGLRMDN